MGSKIRWGILGAAQIARKNWQAIRRTGNSTVAAVASRDAARARDFIAECQADVPMEAVPRASGSYEELLAAPDIDAVYIPLPTGLRKEWVIRAAEAGKHVVCEKPCATSVSDLREILEQCRRKRVQFMDGVMFMHSHRLARMREILGDGTSVGSLKRISSAFSYGVPPEQLNGNIRGNKVLEPYGCLGDLGWYCIRLALWALNEKLPERVTGRTLKESGGVPTEFSGELFFENGVSSSFYCSFLTTIEQWAVLSGEKGYIRIGDFVLPSEQCCSSCSGL